MSSIVWFFVCLVIFGGAARSWLEFRNCHYLQAQSGRQNSYAIARGKTVAFEAIANAGVILWWTVGGGLGLVDRIWNTLLEGPTAAFVGVTVVATVVALMALVRVIFKVVRVFGIDARFGLNRTRPQVFLADLVKKTALGLMLLIPASIVALWMIGTVPTFWWLAVWALWSVIELAEHWLYPIAIVPLFQRVTPLEDGPLKSNLQALARRAGLATNKIEVVDASARSGHANASFTGIGKSRRVLLFDTLISTLAPGEIEAVVAHELGHRKHAHVPIYLAIVSLLRLAALAAFAWIVSDTSFLQSLGFSDSPPHIVLVLLGMSIVATTPFIQPFRSRLVRGFEYEADAFAGKLTPVADLISALDKLNRNNRTATRLDSLYATLLMPHPLPDARARRLLAIEP